jgi:hypothetical protein
MDYQSQTKDHSGGFVRKPAIQKTKDRQPFGLPVF